MSLHEQWLAEPTELSFAEWKRQLTVPAGLLQPQPVVVQRAERAKKAPPPRAKAPRVHGTGWGWRQHKREGEEPCEECKEGKRAEDRAWKAKQPKKGPRKIRPCGTATAARRHRRLGEPVDDACREAERKSWRDAARQRRSA